MAVKNFVFRENWVGSEVASMKIAFFDIFDPTFTHILAPTDPNVGFLKQNFIFNPLERQNLYYYQLCDFAGLFRRGVRLQAHMPTHTQKCLDV